MPARLGSAVAAVAVVLAIFLVACGGGRRDEGQSVRGALTRFQAAAARHDYPTLCGQVLARQLVERVTESGLPCETALRVGLGGVSQPQLTVERVTVQGNDALAVVRSTAAGQPPSVDTVRLVKEGASWRVANLTSAPRAQGPLLGPSQPAHPAKTTVRQAAARGYGRR